MIVTVLHTTYDLKPIYTKCRCAYTRTVLPRSYRQIITRQFPPKHNNRVLAEWRHNIVTKRNK